MPPGLRSYPVNEPPRRFVRLFVGWDESEWLYAISGHACNCWPRLLCWVKRNGVAGRCKSAAPAVLAGRWKVDFADVVELLGAALEHGAVIAEGGDWIVPNWSVYQEADSTAAERQRKFRASRSLLSTARQKPDPDTLDGKECNYCGSTDDLTIDHIKPTSLGGPHENSNLQILCRSCNSSKQARDDTGVKVKQKSTYLVTRYVTDTKEIKDPVEMMHAVWHEELGGSHRLNLTTNRRTLYLAMYSEQLEGTPNPHLAWRAVLTAVKRSPHHMSVRGYQMPESLLRDADRRSRWVQDAVDMIDRARKKSTEAEDFAASYKAKHTNGNGAHA